MDRAPVNFGQEHLKLRKILMKVHDGISVYASKHIYLHNQFTKRYITCFLPHSF